MQETTGWASASQGTFLGALGCFASSRLRFPSGCTSQAAVLPKQLYDIRTEARAKKPCGGWGCWRDLLETQQSRNLDSEKGREMHSDHAGLAIAGTVGSLHTQDTVFQARLVTWLPPWAPAEYIAALLNMKAAVRASQRCFHHLQSKV